MLAAMKVGAGGTFAITDQGDDCDVFACSGRGFQWVTCLRCAAYRHIRNRYLRQYRSGCVHGRSDGRGEAQARDQYVSGKAQRRKSQDRTRNVARGARALHADGGLSVRQQGRRRWKKKVNAWPLDEGLIDYGQGIWLKIHPRTNSMPPTSSPTAPSRSVGARSTRPRSQRTC